MKIQYEIISNFHNYEYTTKTKILLNICNTTEYGVTDTNTFYSRFYNKIEREFKENTSKNRFGNISFCKIFTYHIICNMFCVNWPKTYYNLTPFSIECFKICCVKLRDYMKKNDIKNIISPIFGTEILQGNWKQILTILNDTFVDDINYIIFR